VEYANGDTTVNKDSKGRGIPCHTLREHLSLKRYTGGRMGSNNVLSGDKICQLAERIIRVAEAGFVFILQMCAQLLREKQYYSSFL
jgi:hypothetical protein